MSQRHRALDRRPLRLVGWVCLTLAAVSAAGYQLQWGSTAIFGIDTAFALGLAAGALVASWWALAGGALSGAAIWAFATSRDDMRLDFGGELSSLTAYTAVQLIFIGIPVAFGVIAAHSRERARLESTDVLFPRVWAHIFDIWLLWNVLILFGAADVGILVGVAAGFLYFGCFQGRVGWTLGKRIMRLRVIGPDGRVPGIKRAIKRYLTMLVEWTGVIGLWAAMQSPTHQRFGDRWAETRVVAVDR